MMIFNFINNAESVSKLNFTVLWKLKFGSLLSPRQYQCGVASLSLASDEGAETLYIYMK